MLEFIKKRSKTIGKPPGTLIHIGEKKTERARITIINYNKAHFEENAPYFGSMAGILRKLSC